MSKAGRNNEKVRMQICRAIGHQASHPEKLQTLVVRLQEVLRAEAPRDATHEVPQGKPSRHPEDPFDKIMLV